MFWIILFSAIALYALGVLTGRVIHRIDYKENGADD